MVLNEQKTTLIVHQTNHDKLSQDVDYEIQIYTKPLHTSETTKEGWELLREMFMMDREHVEALMRIEAELSELLPHVSKHRIEELQRVIAKHFVKRFASKHRKAKYGNISKCFTDSEIQAFFKAIKDEKMHLLFMFQAQLAMRIGEVVQLNLKDLNLETRELLIHTEKEGAGVVDSLIVPMDLFNETLEFIRGHSAQIEKAQGFVFYANESKTRRKGLYLEKNGVRASFRKACIKAGLTQVYSVTDESIEGRSVRKLHRLTTHSLRHYAITRFAKQSNGNLILTSRFARHRSPNTTMTYVAKDKEKLYETIEQTSALNDVIKLKERVR